MGLGGDLTGDLEQLLASRTLARRALFRMTGPSSQCWRAEVDVEQMYPGMRCRLLPSATVGLSLVLEVLGLQPGQEVLIPPFGWLSNWSCIRRAGLVPRFLPLDSQLQIRPEDVRDRITARTGAVIVTHLMGRGQQGVAEIATVCAERGVPMLEDIAQSFGVSVNGQRAGTFGAAAWCSLNHHKILSTGDGGFILVKDAEVFTKVTARHDQGCIVRNGTRRPAEHLEPGLSLRFTDLTASVFRAQLARFNVLRARIIKKHCAVARVCEQSLGLRLIRRHEGDVPFTVLFERPASMRYPTLRESGWHVAPNVPWLTSDDWHGGDESVARTLATLDAIGAVGAGFIDPYYAIANGVGITDGPEALTAFVEAMEKTL